MFQFKKITAAVAIAALGLFASQAAEASTLQTFSFNWSKVPFAKTTTFTIGLGEEGTLSLNDYSGTTKATETGFVLDNGTHFTTATNKCVAGGGVFALGCNVISGLTANGTILFSGLGVGTYTLGIYESGVPKSGFLKLDLAVSAVPLPAGGLLLLGALGGAAALRKRRKLA